MLVFAGWSKVRVQCSVVLMQLCVKDADVRNADVRSSRRLPPPPPSAATSICPTDCPLLR